MPFAEVRIKRSYSSMEIELDAEGIIKRNLWIQERRGDSVNWKLHEYEMEQLCNQSVPNTSEILNRLESQGYSLITHNTSPDDGGANIYLFHRPASAAFCYKF